MHAIAAAVAVVSSVAALALLLLPVVLVLLMVLFDITAHGVLVLLGLLLGWLRAFLPDAPQAGDGSGFHPLGVASAALLHALPVIGGLLCAALGRHPRNWCGALLLWGAAALWDGSVVAATLVPALVGATICALSPGHRESGRKHELPLGSGGRTVSAYGDERDADAHRGASNQPDGAPDGPAGQGRDQQGAPQRQPGFQRDQKPMDDHAQ